MLTPGGTLGGRYRLDERIATGGMGDMWKAEDTVLGRVVAVKILQAALLDEPGFQERFRAEARVMATLNHPGVVRVYDYGESGVDGGGQVAYLVMEYVEGEPLSHTLSRVGRLTPDRTMNLLAQAGEALHAAHEHGIVHRDVKPGNLLVRPDGKLVLIDFGIARSAISGQLTTAGSILGTASYVSPEQATGTGAITAASDVYSLGVVGYQCLSGHRPFEGENPLQVAMKHIRDVPQPLPADVPPPVRTVIDRAMAKDPAQRWPSAAAMAEACRQAGAGNSPTAAFGATAPMAGANRTAVLGAAPTSGPGASGYRSGAAAVPSGPPYGAGPADEGYTSRTPRRQGRGLMVAGVVFATLVVLAGLGGIGYALLSSGDGNNRTPSGQPSATASRQQSGQNHNAAITLPDQGRGYLHQPYDQVAQDLTSKGLNPVPRKGRFDPNYNAGEVNRIRYNTPLHTGDPVYVYVQPGNGNGQGNGQGNDNGHGNGGNPFPTLPGTGGDNGGGDNGGGDDGGQSQAPPTPTTGVPSATPTPTPSGGGDQGTGFVRHRDGRYRSDVTTVNTGESR